MPAMLDTSQYREEVTGGIWKGNSSYQAVTQGISTGHLERWRTVLDPAVIRLIEVACGPDMAVLGYDPEVRPSDVSALPDWIGYVLGHQDESVNWRTDIGDPQQDVGYELFRRALLEMPGTPDIDPMLIRRSFLFEAAYARLRAASSAKNAVTE